MENVKTCSKCKKSKKISMFIKDKTKKDLLKTACKQCIKIEYDLKKDILKEKRQANKRKVKDYNKRYREEKRRIGEYERDSHRSRARKLNAKYESGITIFKLIKRDGGKCLICKKKVLSRNVSGYHKDNATIGHIVSMANGGSHTWSNIQMECMECNTKKGISNGGQLRLF